MREYKKVRCQRPGRYLLANNLEVLVSSMCGVIDTATVSNFDRNDETINIQYHSC